MAIKPEAEEPKGSAHLLTRRLYAYVSTLETGVQMVQRVLEADCANFGSLPSKLRAFLWYRLLG